MGRSTTTNLTNQLAATNVWTQSTLDLVLRDTSEYHFATDAFTGTNGEVYTADLRKVGEIKQSISAATDRVNVTIQNVDKTFGGVVTDEDLVKAEAIVGRQYGDPFVNGSVWVELFRGEAKAVSIDENEVVLEILNDLAAAGFCVSHWSLAENCQFVYKHAGTCGYAGAEATCNKRRKSPDGCSGRIVTGTTTNEYRYGGMEYPEPQTTAPPSGGIDDGGGGWLPCPRTDQFVLVRAHWTPQPRPKRVSMLGSEDELYNPISGEFTKIESIIFVPDEPIWLLRTRNLARGNSSGSHPVIADAHDRIGTRVDRMKELNRVLTWSNGELYDNAATRIEITDERGTVAKIKMVSGHIYAYSDTSSGPFIVCHNSKDPDGGGGGVVI